MTNNSILFWHSSTQEFLVQALIFTMNSGTFLVQLFKLTSILAEGRTFES